MPPSRVDQLIIRHAHPGDLESLVRFNAAMAWETERRQLDETRLRMGTKGVLDVPARGWYVLAELTNRPSGIIGQLLVTFEWSDWRNANLWWLQSVYVHPDWRKQGVFRRLYEFVLNEAKAEPGVGGIRLYVEQGNSVAQETYRSIGLSPTPYQVFEDDFVLSKKAKESIDT